MAAEDLPRQAHNPEDITEEHSFDELARGLANGTVSRRRALRLLGGALLGGVLASIPGVALAQPEGRGGPPGGSQGCPYPGQIRVFGGRCDCPSGQVLCNNACVNGPFCGENEHFNSTTCRCECIDPEALCGDICCPTEAPCCGGAVCCPSAQVCCGDACCAPGEECNAEGQCVTPASPTCAELQDMGFTCEGFFGPGYSCCEAERAIFCCGPEAPVGQCGSSVSGCVPLVSG